MWQRLATALGRHQATVVKQNIFGSLSARTGSLRLLQQVFGRIDWPLSWVEGVHCGEGLIAGSHLLAVQGTEVEPVLLAGERVGSAFQDESARHCFLGNVTPTRLDRPAPDQCRDAYAKMEAALGAAGMVMTDLVRTWFFLDDILAWYDEFNELRRDLYRRKRMIKKLVPASTGVGARNPAGAAMLADAWALRPLNGSMLARELASPLQCPAPNYGSCFSRALELTTLEHRHLLISGTASIEPGGRSIHNGDIEKQIGRTMEVIQGLLRSNGMSFLDVTRATAYFKHPRHAPIFEAWCARHCTSFLPTIATRAVVCRDELLFELEVDALTGRGSAR